MSNVIDGRGGASVHECDGAGGFSGVQSRAMIITRPPSENGDGCSTNGIVNNVNSDTTPFPPPLPPSPPASIHRRRDRSLLQKEKEANRSRQFLQRSATSASEQKEEAPDFLGRKRTRTFRRQTTNSPPEDSWKALEPSNEQSLTRMAYAEQQKWITVQQKTFTKWLNTKIEPRDLAVVDLVKDLSDGVRFQNATNSMGIS